MDFLKGITDKILGGPKEGRLENVSDQSTDEVNLVGFVKDKVQEVRSSTSRVANESVWLTNSAYLLGFDSIVWDSTTKQFRPNTASGRPLSKNRLHVNKILPTIQNRLARLCKNPPKYDVRPNSNSTDDKDAARLGMQVIEMIWDKEKINQKRLDLYMWMQQAGHSYIKISWDSEKGKQLPDPDSPEGALMYEGDIRIDIVSPFEIFPDPLAKRFDDVQWMVQAKVRKLDYFRTHYPDRGHLVKEEGAWLLSTQYEMRINSMNSGGTAGSHQDAKMKNSAIELAYYERPSSKNPQGRLVITANGVLLDDKELPVGELPFSKFDDVLVAGKYNSESIITHLRPVQDQYNRLINRRADWMNKLLAGKYIAAKGHGLMKEALNDQSGEVVEYNPVPNAAPPSAMQIPMIPQYAYEEEQSLEKKIYDIAGINEVSRGQLPSASMPAVGMQFLMEQDDTRIGIVTESNEYSWARVGQLVLMYAESFYKTERLLKIAKGMEHTVKSFVGSDLRGNTDVIVIRGSTIPGSKVLKRQEILNTYSQGLLGDPNDPKVREKVLSMLEYGDVAEMWQDIAVDKAQIQRQIAMIEQGQAPAVSEFDNHPLHLQEKNLYRKSDKFDTLSPDAQMILLQNMEEHVQALITIANPTMPHDMQMAQDMANQSNQGLNQAAPPPEGATPQGVPPQ